MRTERIHDGLIVQYHKGYADFIYTIDGKSIHITRFKEPCDTCGSNHIGCSKMQCMWGIHDPENMEEEII